MPNNIEGSKKIGILTHIGALDRFKKFKGFETHTRNNFEKPGVGEVEVLLLRKDMLCCIDSRDSAPLDTLDRENKLHHQKKTIYDHPYDGIKIPGGTIGLFLVAAAVIPDLSADKIVKLVKEFEKDQGRDAAFHDDTHAGTCGCGHVAMAAGMENPSIYGISRKRVNEIKEAFADEIRNGMPVNKAILDGKHQETQVWKVIKRKKNEKNNNRNEKDEINETVKSADPKKKVFIYDETAYHEILEKLAIFTQGKGINATKEALIATADKQADATLRILAPNLPVFEIDLTGPITDVPKVTFQGTVPALACAA